MNNERLYEIRNNHRGTPMQIIRYGNWNDIDVEFLDDFHHIKEHQTYSNFKSGSIKNPYDRNVYGIGYLGEGNHVIKIGTDKSQPYKAWHELIARCYAEKKKDTFPAYYNICTVCDEWLCYNTFADWYVENQYEVNERLHLDKDILYAGNKIYSPKTCLLVPQRINMLFSNKPNDRGLPNGIRRTDSGKYSAKYGGKDIGTYPTLEEAYAEYARVKEKRIREVADEYKNIIPEKVYKALYDYKVRIENDKNYVA